MRRVASGVSGETGCLEERVTLGVDGGSIVWNFGNVAVNEPCDAFFNSTWKSGVPLLMMNLVKFPEVAQV